MRHAKAVLITACVLAGAGSARADQGPGTFAIWGEAGFPSFSKFNSDGANAVKDAKAAGADLSTQKDIGSDFGAFVAFNYDVDEITSVGIRAGYLMTSHGKQEIKSSRTSSGVMDSTTDTSLHAIPIMVGGSLRHVINDHLDVRASLFAGMALTGGTATYKTPSNDLTFDGTGSAFTGEVSVGANMKLTDATTLGLEIGYRLLSTELENTDDVKDSTGAVILKKGEKFDDLNGDPAKYDLSGLFVHLGLTLHL
jgi:hypothetical protein